MLQLVPFELLSILQSLSLKVPTALIKMVQSGKICNIAHDGSTQGTTVVLHFLRAFMFARAQRLFLCPHFKKMEKLGGLLPKGKR